MMARERSLLSSDRLRRRVITSFTWVVLGYLILGSVKLIIGNYQIHQQTAKLQSDYATVQQRNQELKSLLAYYSTDSYKEKEARARLNYQKPGERVVVVPVPPNEDTTSITQPSIETQVPTPPSNPRQWINYFFGKKG